MRFAPVLGLLALAIGCAAGAQACAAPKGSHEAEGDTSRPTLETDSVRVGPHAIKSVFVIVMENHDWNDIKGSASAPYINGTLLKQGAHAEKYTSPQNIHPSEPNYIWLEAGDDLDIADDDDPNLNYRTTKNHLTRQMENAGVGWKSYQEGITPELCPVASSGRYGAKHNPFVFFDDITHGRDPHSAHCIAHVRPYEDLDRDLAAGTAGRYNFITPDMCNDMHDSAGCNTPDSIANGDAWLSREVPKIQASKAYQDGGVIFITWDESEGGVDTPIGLIAISPLAKLGYSNEVAYTHSSLLRTVQDVFALRPFMRDAANVRSLDDLFVSYP